MELLRIESINNYSVVDSRLIAEELGIKHKTFLETIRKYETEIQAFGQLAVETATVTNSVGARNKTVFAYLNEDQATFVMTLSRNTPQVVQCKMKLVKSFAIAKQLLKEKVVAKNIEGYLPARKECTDQLKRHGATGSTYGAVERYNNDLNSLEKDKRHECTLEQVQGLTINYLSAAVELLKREEGFNKNQRHLQNTAKKAMRHSTYNLKGEDSVPEHLKPKHERKLLE